MCWTTYLCIDGKSNSTECEITNDAQISSFNFHLFENCLAKNKKVYINMWDKSEEASH